MTGPAEIELGAATLLVTGAASGIGAALARRFATAGIGAAYLVDVDEPGLAEVAAHCADAGVRCEHAVVDVRDADALRGAFDAAQALTGTLEFVHNNVGIMTGFPAFPETPLELMDRVLAVNLRSVLLGVQFALPRMGPRGGSILNTSSLAASITMPADPIYASTKAAVSHFTRCCVPLARKQGVRINALCPGVVDTAILAQNEHPQYQPKRSADALAEQGFALLRAEDVAAVAFEMLTDPQLTGELRIVGNERLDPAP